jgi:hypothetical protein
MVSTFEAAPLFFVDMMATEFSGFPKRKKKQAATSHSGNPDFKFIYTSDFATRFGAAFLLSASLLNLLKMSRWKKFEIQSMPFQRSKTHGQIVRVNDP